MQYCISCCCCWALCIYLFIYLLNYSCNWWSKGILTQNEHKYKISTVYQKFSNNISRKMLVNSRFEKKKKKHVNYQCHIFHELKSNIKIQTWNRWSAISTSLPPKMNSFLAKTSVAKVMTARTVHIWKQKLLNWT